MCKSHHGKTHHMQGGADDQWNDSETQSIILIVNGTQELLCVIGRTQCLNVNVFEIAIYPLPIAA